MKTNIAPLKKKLVHKLDSVLHSYWLQYFNLLQKIICIKVDKNFALSDSAVDLGWLVKNSSQWNVFIANQILAIHWSHWLNGEMFQLPKIQLT